MRTSEENKIYMREYYLNNKDKWDNYRDTHKEEIRDRKKTYRENNKEKLKAKKSTWYQENKEKILEKRKKYYVVLFI